MNDLCRPNAIVFDLDDTLILSDGTVADTWKEACQSYHNLNPTVDPDILFQQIKEMSIWFWSDTTRHRLGRNDMDKTRRDLTIKAFQNLGLDDDEGAIRLADQFTQRRYEVIELFPGAISVLKQVRQAGIRLGMLTNGESIMQRTKINRFQLEPYFDVIQIEGEKGVGKPEIASYTSILDSLEVTAEETWIVGDNLEWEVVVPQTIGLTAIWLNYYQRELPNSTIKPDRTISEISQLSEILIDSLRN